MKQAIISFCFLLLLLATALSGCGQPVTTTTSSTSSTPTKTAVVHSGGSGIPCETGIPSNTGLSYDANSYKTEQQSDANFGFFQNTSSNAPAVGAIRCVDSNGTELYVGNTTADSYKVRVTINGVTSQLTYSSSMIYRITPDYNLIGFANYSFPAPTNHQYTFQVQSCQLLVAPGSSRCSAWSSDLIVTVVANAYCQSGYVWRVATPFDLVCVTPAERAQVANDNSQASARVNPNGAYGPYTCVSGYVWRNAFGGDFVCVTPGQRAQVQNDNSQATARVAAF